MGQAAARLPPKRQEHHPVNRTLKLAMSTFFAFGLCAQVAATETVSAPEGPTESLQANGLRWNGVVLNGPLLQSLRFNGMRLNGPILQGWKINGLKVNGPLLQGWEFNGLRVNGPLLQGFRFNGVALQRPVAMSPVRSTGEAQFHFALADVGVSLPAARR